MTRTSTAKQTWIVPSANIYVKDLDLRLERNKPVAVRNDVATNLVDTLQLARNAKAGEIKEAEAEATAETATEVTDGTSD